MAGREFLNRPKNHWALLRETSPPNNRLAVFIHGFRGNYLDTWGRLPDLLSQHANAHPFQVWDYLFVGYDTRRVETYLDISNRLATELRGAFSGTAPYSAPYAHVALFGHSLGTLGIRQLLCATSEHPCDFLCKLHSVTLLGTPLVGSVWAHLAFGYSVGRALEPENPQLRMLRYWVNSSYQSAPWKPVRIVLGQDDQVVGAGRVAGFVDWAGDTKPADFVDEDHSSLVKPSSWTTSTLVDLLRRTLCESVGKSSNYDGKI